MLQRVISIRNVGRFRRTAASGDVSFRRVTLVLGENGRGKTTLCAILRSLSKNAPALVQGRATLGTGESPAIELRLDAGTLSFRDGAWSAPFDQFAVFDGTYVSDNVFAGEVVDTEHRRNLYRVIIGAEGVALAGRLNALEDQIRTKNTEVRELRQRLQPHVPPGMTVDAFIALPEDAAIDEKIGAKEQELLAVRRAADIQERHALSPITAPTFPAPFAEVLARSFENVAAGAERRVADHVARHRMEARGETWLTEGLGYVVDDSCPFCEQPIAGNDLIQTYRTYFSARYHALREEIAALNRQVDDALSERGAAAIEQRVLQNANGVEFWRQYCEFAPPVLAQAGAVAGTIASFREAAQALLRAKTAAPLERVAPDEAYTRAWGAFEALRESIAVYNAAVAAANAAIDARKRVTRAANVRDVETALARLRAQRARHEVEVRALCEEEARRQGEKRALDGEKEGVRTELDRHTRQVVARYAQAINGYLERINAGFRITTPAHTYRGGTPSTSYQIVINQTAVDLGDSATPLDRPSFRNTLSAGDRSTLALAFFLAQLQQDPDRTRKVVVFDDPFSSQDGFRRNHTIYQIQKCAEACAQVIVLSHEPLFLKALWDRIPPADRKTLRFARVGEDNTNIVECDLEKETQARHRSDVEALCQYLADGDGERREVIQKLRPVLEGFYRHLYPAQFGDQDTLGVIVGKIRGGASSHPLSDIADDLNEINLYCRRYHHGEAPAAATEPIDDEELRGYVRRTLKLVGHF